MKKLLISCLLLAVILSTAHAQYGTERTGYEGDYFSLHGALDLFKQSHTLRDFERRLNTEENWVNNLDLNYDRQIDYIRVEHRRQGNFHIIVLQALLDRYEVQDVAVIEIEVIGRREAILQMVGDEDLYGEEVIIEPVEGYSDSRRRRHSEYGDFVNVFYWRPVQYILDTQYRLYASPYRWQSYPTWWSPWRQFAWGVFRPRTVIYLNNYTIVRRNRLFRVHNFYRPYRSYCPTVVQRTNVVRVRQGRSPIYRAAPAGRRDGRRNGYQAGRDRYRDRSQIAERPTSSRRNPGVVSRKRTVPPSRPEATGRTSPRDNDEYRRQTRSQSEATSRTTTPQRPTVRSRKATPSSGSRTTTRTAPRTAERYGSTVRRSPANSRKAEPARTARPEVRRSNSGNTSRSRTVTRSTSPSRKSSASSRAPSSSARSQSSRKTTTTTRSKAPVKPRSTQPTRSQSSSRKRVSRNG